MTQFVFIRRLGAAILNAFDSLCDRYERSATWTDKLFLS
jgi:hypothetical protein